MTWEITIMFLVLVGTVVLFIFEIFPVDKIAFLIIITLALSGLVEPDEAISGFSNTATIAVLALMILAIAMEENGVIEWLTSGVDSIKSFPLYIMAPILMFVTAGMSAFISTTAVVIVFVKIVNRLSEKYKVSSSKLLMPISFAGILGGSCTLMGTSTNLIVNAVSSNLGAEKLGFFDFTLFGTIFLVISIIYLTVTLRWLPWSKNKELVEDYNIHDYITRIFISADSKLVGKNIEETFLYNNPEISLLRLTRNNRIHNTPGKYITLRANDEILLMCDLKNLARINESEDLGINEEKYLTQAKKGENESEEKNIDIDSQIFVELLILPGASFIGKTLGNLRNTIMQNVILVAIKKRKTLVNLKERLVRSSMDSLAIKAGDRLLVETTRNNLNTLASIENIELLQEYDKVSHISRRKKYFSLIVLLSVIGLAGSGTLSIMVSALTGIGLLLITQNLDLASVYKKVDWQIFFLLAGMIPLGIAMHNTGADMWISKELLYFLEGKPNYFIIGTLFLTTMLLSGVISNNATAIIMTPIAFAVAQGMQMDFKPFILSVLFAANFSFFTPVGYQTNTLIYSIGNYSFRHFLFIGGILSLLLWITATFLLTAML
ncbi:SLC13 family permease [Pareuzebyella sediminis]|uniref:SLC13 family permease n=1 Tax=Pareuzebyella sediminis TaxID=2607998 RepID=UPI0011EBD08B|nr:SLC13 family permease [Pareuzebyella sediminis]